MRVDCAHGKVDLHVELWYYCKQIEAALTAFVWKEDGHESAKNAITVFKKGL